MAKTAPLQINLAGLNHLLLDAITDTQAGNYVGTFADCDIGLFTSWPGYSPDLELADLTVADFTGYAVQDVTFSQPYDNSDNEKAVTSGDHVWRPTDGVTPNIVIGFYVLDEAGALVGVGVFDESIPMEDENDQVSVILTISMDATLEYGQAVAVD